MLRAQYEAGDDSDESSNGGRKRKLDDFAAGTENTTAISTDVLIKTPHFITKTYQMINDSDENIVAWTEAGDKFIVKDQFRLASECIPLYFSHNNFSSFTRQLNFYRFRKMFPSVKVGPANDFGTMNDKHLIFYHEKFHRDHPELLPDIKRSTKTTRSSAEQEQVIEDLQNQMTDLEKRFDDLSSQVYLKISSISAECDKKIADFQRSMNDRAGAERSVDERRTSERSFMEYNAPSLPTKLSRFTTEDTSLPTTRLNRYTTEDFMRSILHMDGNNGHPRGMDNHSASASVPYAIPSLSQQPRLNRLGTLTLDDINRLVMHLENEGMVTDINAPTWTAPAPTNPVNHIASLSAEDILVALRSMDNPKGPDRDVDGSDNRNNKMSY